LLFLQFFPRAEQERLKREYHSIRQTSSETSTEFMQRFLRLAGFLGTAAGTEEEQAKNSQWGLCRSSLNHLMCMSYTDVAQIANAARNYEILQERDDDDTERPDKQQMSGDRRQPTSQQSSHRSHGQNIDRHESDRRGEVVVTTPAAATTTTLAVTTGIPVMGMARETGVLSSLGVPLRATHAQFALLVDVDTQESVVELLVLALSVVKLVIYRKIARRTPLQSHLVRLIRSQEVVGVEIGQNQKNQNCSKNSAHDN
nr:zinc finger, CCHC-type, retrotransposon Gag domain protein [Tanacetum cinerariifolium]